MWGKHVTKKMPITLKLDALWLDFFVLSDISTLLTKTVVDEMYTMVLQVTSTCDKAIEIGFPGQWFLSYAPAHAKASIITVTDKWRENRDLRLESREICEGKTLTIHYVQLFPGTENCLEGGIIVKFFVNICTSGIMVLESSL